MDRGAWWATVQGGHKRVRHNLATNQQLLFLAVHRWVNHLPSLGLILKGLD